MSLNFSLSRITWWCVRLSTRWISTSRGLSSSFFTCAPTSITNMPWMHHRHKNCQQTDTRNIFVNLRTRGLCVYCARQRALCFLSSAWGKWVMCANDIGKTRLMRVFACFRINKGAHGFPLPLDVKALAAFDNSIHGLFVHRAVRRSSACESYSYAFKHFLQALWDSLTSLSSSPTRLNAAV